jgi:hypothetical protein
MYRVVYGRTPTPDELAAAMEFIHAAPPSVESEQASPWRYGFGRYDEAEKRLVNFEQFPHFEKNAWRGGPQDNDPLLGRCSLNSRGGVAGADRGRSAIRRWIAPRDGTITINATLGVQATSLLPTGEGIRGRIVSSRLGQLGLWIECATEEQTNFAGVEVHRGDAIDFIAEFRGGQDSSASFSWAPVLRYEDDVANASPKKPAPGWDAAKDFNGTSQNIAPFGAWERFAQVLLESNEFLFLD